MYVDVHVREMTKTICSSSPHMKCVVSNMVLPSLCLVSKSQMARLACGSIPDVGSSSTTILEPPIRAIPTLHKRHTRTVYILYILYYLLVL